MADNHSHDQGAVESGWFRALDALVWVSVAVIVVLAAEWFVGVLIRERIASGARRYLAKQPAAPDQA